jgi:hypothetical protein
VHLVSDCRPFIGQVSCEETSGGAALSFIDQPLRLRLDMPSNG